MAIYGLMTIYGTLRCASSRRALRLV